MFVLEGILHVDIEVFMLIFVRMTGLFVIAPIFGSRNIPTYCKIGFSFMTALILVNTIKVQELYFSNIYEYFILVLKEFLVGITLGYVAYMIFTAIYVAGQFIDMQIGFGVVNVIDPLNSTQVSITSNFYFLLCMLVFLICRGHYILIRALFASYNYIPVGTGVFGEDMVNDIVRVFGNIFLIAFKISAPITISIMISEVALGIVSKTVPQLNVFMVGMPLKIILGLAVMVITIPMFLNLVENLITGIDNEMHIFLKDMAPK
ncbi:MAG TPA: flagellar type III secretion system protein FliR [Hungateiclostridium thermocellum]|uniref:Flagellar biosynthetic protein FliR n=2 Tax=Acetivibrio thermocellus TaxID=1515 RepID=A3DCP2_ACET2|nr:flagellar biosynthetic protein FliR [Acetivibrio thermocellus]CDG35197.1 flagellar biosynthesis protein FliR [Acetivibrio thermocellus BC1]ABN51721.1 flagellar biosynthetic protein FliR [Acetivibrio thermocellus ATCC 27405]ADU74794.1 flagellar biosynthetic protein FliR [Acetivibrio thermocellus DSM 1313]ALX08746.1 flagellar biosynthetic protein FliR [Acetivibrio thermocellus AD2]ANV76498.1 flagellar biosynthetic protein FliR [Acetivibrio thermocellus DSM 2360]